MGSFAYGLVTVGSEVCKNILKRRGDQGDKHGHLLRGSCDRCSAIFIFRVLLENSAFAVSDIAARDLISSYFRFPWELTPVTFGLSFVPSALASNCPLSRDILRPCTLLGGEGTVSGTRGEYLVNMGIPFS
jgi:hypothetical protein